MPTTEKRPRELFFRIITDYDRRLRGIEARLRTEASEVGGDTVAWADVTGKPASFPSTWSLVTGKPTDFPTAWSLVSGKPDIPTAAGAGNNSARWCMGPDDATYGRSVSGGGFFAVWMDNGNRFGRNVSSRRYKVNIRDHRIMPGRVLQLEPRMFDRKDVVEDGEKRVGQKDEYGLIAEEVADAGLPELVTWFDGEIDGIRYDLLAVALLEVVKDQERRLRELERRWPGRLRD